jgi:uncharacterized delta-60 repeat protein
VTGIGSNKFLRILLVSPIVLATLAGSMAWADGIPTRVRFFDGSGTPVAVAIQSDGRVLAAGSIIRSGASDTDFAVMRFNLDGTPDATFGIGGRLTTDFSATDDRATAVAIQADGKILVAGFTTVFLNPGCSTCPTKVVALARYTTAGILDGSFGSGGKVVLPYTCCTVFESGYESTAIAVAPNTDIFVAAWFNPGGQRSRSYRLHRFTSSGAFLPEWNVASQSLGSPHPFAFGNDGTVVTAGLNQALNFSFVRARLTRYTAAGDLDPTFGGTGVVDGLGGSPVAVQSDGKVVAGFTRLTAAGALDTAFGQNGTCTDAAAYAHVVTVAPDRSIVGVGSTLPPPFIADFAVSVVSSAGALIQNYTTDFGGDDVADAVAVRADGSILAAGLSTQAGRTDVAWTQLVVTPWRPLLPSALTIDFDGDRKADMVALARNGEWRIATSSTGFASRVAYRWGAANDIPLTADFNGDRRTDLSVFRHGAWYVIDPHTLQQASYVFGGADVPVPGDYDGDGRTELAFYRAGWYIYNFATNAYNVYPFGTVEDIPIPRDFDGDGKTDLAVYRPSTGVWQVFNIATGATSTYQWGIAGDIPVPADYFGKGYMAIAIYRPSTGEWWIYDPGTGEYFGFHWGAPGDVPVPGDYIGDRRTELACFRPATGAWFVHDLGTGAFLPVGLGAPNEPPY